MISRARFIAVSNLRRQVTRLQRFCERESRVAVIMSTRPVRGIFRRVAHVR